MPIRKLPAALVMAAFCMVALPLRAEVKDPTGTFSKQAVDQADNIINQVKQISGRDVVVEVFPEIPANVRGQYSEGVKDQFFSNWGNQRANALKLNGIYVMLCRNPSYLKVLAGQHTRERDFTSGDCDRLAALMLQHLHTKDFDGALIQGMDFVLQEVRGNRGAATVPPGRSTNGQTTTPQYHSNVPARTSGNQGSSHWWLWLLIIVGGGLFLLSMLRRRFAGATGAYGPSGYGPTNYYGGGYPTRSGGFGRGLMGGLLGGMAGGWLYDRFRGHPGQGNPPAGSGGEWNQGGQADADLSDQGQGFTGSGGDFGGSSDAGGGFGGGDFGGGGDAGGGGDFGGGGGDSGSGGSF